MMKRMNWIFITAVIFGGLLLSACSPETKAVEKVEPVILVPITGKNFNEITLTALAAERLDIQTSFVTEEQINGTSHIVVPYSSLIYDINGDTWVYINSAPLTFHREAIIVDFIEGDMVVILDGPPVGTEVAIQGVAQLYGVDTGVGQ